MRMSFFRIAGPQQVGGGQLQWREKHLNNRRGLQINLCFIVSKDILKLVQSTWKTYKGKNKQIEQRSSISLSPAWILPMCLDFFPPPPKILENITAAKCLRGLLEACLSPGSCWRAIFKVSETFRSETIYFYHVLHKVWYVISTYL